MKPENHASTRAVREHLCRSEALDMLCNILLACINRTLNPQVLGSIPRERTNKTAGQTANLTGENPVSEGP